MPAFSAEERRLLHDSIEAFFTDRYPLEHALRLGRSEPEGFGRGDWAAYAELGWLGLTLPEAAGGAGGGMTEAGILMAAAGKHLAQEPFVPTLVLAAGALNRLGVGAQRALLEEIATGRGILGFCHYEADSGFARDHVTTVAAKRGAGYELTGRKAFSLGAHAADSLLVSARIGSAAGPVGLFIVPGAAAGLERVGAPALDGRRGAALRLRGVALGGEALLGDLADDRIDTIDRLYDRAALAVCAEAVGAMTKAAALTTEYIRDRQQFGRPLSGFQVLQHRVVDMHIKCEECRATVHAALVAADREAPDLQRIVWRTKVTVAQAARFVGAQGIQLHGGMGMTDALAIGHYYKRLSVLEAMFGDADWHLDRLAAGDPAEAWDHAAEGAP